MSASKKCSLVLRSLSALALTALVAGQIRAAEGPTVSGFVDVGYSYNFNGRRTNMFRGFDANANSFILQNAEAVVSGKSDNDVMYRVDVGYGNDPSVINGFDGFAPTTAQVGLQQAYLSSICPWTGGTVTFGKFVTPFGAEVIEAKDNYNQSRGFLFNLAIPLLHTGLKYDKGFSDGKYNLTAGGVNGWDAMRDNNKGKTILAQGTANVSEKVSVIVGGAYGPEQTATTPPTPSIEKNSRTLVDTIIKVMPSDKLTLVLNHDWGVEEGLANKADQGTQNWSGIAGYVNYAFKEDKSVAVRYETFTDEGSRILNDVDLNGVNDDEVTLNSLTLTLSCKKNDVTSRIEYRMDSSDEDIFVDKDGKADDSQNTIGLSWSYAF
jgi:hypothetical protein